MILGLFWMMVANAGAIFATVSVWSRTRTGVPCVDALLFVLVRVLLISGVVIVAGLTSTLRALPLGLLGCATISILAALREYRFLHRVRIPGIPKLLIVGMGIVLIRLLAQVWFFAPYVGDVASYHLPKVAEWIRAGAFTREMGVDTHVTFPAGFELLETWWVVFLHHDVLIEVAGLEFLIISFAAVNALATLMGLDRIWALFAAFLYVMTPGLHLQSTACMNDGPTTALLLSAMALVVARIPVEWVCVPVGLGLGVKPTFAYAAPGFLLLWFLTRKEASVIPAVFARIRWLTATALAVGGFWYARNLAWFGNPFFPMGSKGIVEVAGRTTIQFGPSAHSLFANALGLLEARIYDDKNPYGPLMTGISGWGAVGFSCGLVSLLLFLRKDPGIRKVAAAFLVSAGSILLLVSHDDWSLRFVLFLPALLCIAAAWQCQKSKRMTWLCASALAMEFLGTCLPGELSANGFQVLAQQPWIERSAAPLYGATLSKDSVGYFADHYGEVYVLYGADYSRRVEYLRSRSREELIRDMKCAGVSQLYAVPTSLAHVKILEDCLRRKVLQQITDRIFVLK